MSHPDESSAPAEPVIMDPAAEAFYSGAVKRILRLVLALAVPGCLATLAIANWRVALGFSGGAALGYLNFRWLAVSVEGLSARIAEAHLPEDAKLGSLKAASALGLAVRFIGRILLVALAGYGILRGSRASLLGFVAGLAVPVAAMLVEAVYELTTAVRRGL